jgi:agmatine deiminase
MGFIPRQPYDMTGHADGMLRFLDDKTLLVNDYQGESESWKKKYVTALQAINLEVVVLPSVVLDEKNESGDYTARGCYINFAQIGNKILLPFFDLAEDELVRKEMLKLYPDCRILPVEANEIAQDGGVLNCITWNIKR